MSIDIEKQLRSLQGVKPSQSLYDKLDLRIVADPARSSINMPLIAFRLAIAAVVLVIFVSISSGVILAAKGSSEGSILFPVRQALERLPQPFLPKAPTPTPGVRIHSSESEQENEDDKKTEPREQLKHNIQRVESGSEKETEKQSSESESGVHDVLNAAITPVISIPLLKKEDN